MLLDPKRVKRILANRESAARSKVSCTWQAGVGGGATALTSTMARLHRQAVLP
jgi:hypothetical protein